MRAVSKAKEAFRTISEVASELDVPQHVLRFWESKFSQVRPMKRGGNRRYYRPEDVELLSAIRHHLYTEGYTIKGVQKLLRANGVRSTIEAWHEAESGEPEVGESPPVSPVLPVAIAPAIEKPAVSKERELVEAVLDELRSIRKFIEECD